jgi:hypothetical protein
VSPYFYVLALFNSFQILTLKIQLYSNHFQERCFLFYSYKRCKQLSLSITTTNTLIKLSSLSYYVITATNKRYTYPRVTTIQIDVHPTGENPINTPHAFHARSAYCPRPYISCGPHGQPFASPDDVKMDPYTRKKSWRPKTN